MASATLVLITIAGQTPAAQGGEAARLRDFPQPMRSSGRAPALAGRARPDQRQRGEGLLDAIDD
jgi:hypothetical protein